MSDQPKAVRRILDAGWLLLCAPPVLTALDAARSTWTPVVDNALIAALTLDSLTSDPPLVGMPTSLGLEAGEPLSHPGPLAFWAMAVPTRLLGPEGEGLLVGALLVSVACIVAIAAVLRRSPDRLVEPVGLVLVSVMAACLGPGVLSSPFNPHQAVLPLLLCGLAAAGVVAGRHRQLWAVVVGGGLAAQLHVAFLPVAVAFSVLAVGAVLVDARRRPELRRRLIRVVLPGTVVLGLLVWSGPLVDQLVGSQNLTRLVTNRTSGQPTAGFDHAFDVVVEMTAVPPRWAMGRAADRDLSDPSPLRVASSAVVLTVAAASLVWAVRRRDRVLVGLDAVGLVGVAVAAVATASITDPGTNVFFEPEEALIYHLAWWPVGVLLWLGVVRSAMRLAAPRVAPRLPAALVARPALAMGLVVLALVPLAATGRPEHQPALEAFFTHEVVHGEAVADLPEEPQAVVLHLAPPWPEPPWEPEAFAPTGVWALGPDRRYGYAANLVAQLRLQGIEVRFADEPDGGVVFMRSYRDAHPARGDEAVELYYLVGADAERPPPDGYRLVSRSPAAGLLAPTTAVLQVEAPAG